MSAHRPSTGGVRNLRAMFENPDATSSPEPRGRSPAASAVSDTPSSRTTSKIRASFVSVDSSGFLPRESSAARSTSRTNDVTSPLAQRRESFSLRRSRDSEAPQELKKTMSNEVEERKKSVDMGVEDEVVPESAIDSGSTATPNIEPKDKIVSPVDAQPPEIAPHSTKTIEEEALPTAPNAPAAEPLLEKTNLPEPATEVEAPLVNPDKPTSVTEETPAAMKPSDPTDASAISGGEALPEPQEPLATLSEPAPPAAVDPVISQAPIEVPTAVDTPAATPVVPKSEEKSENSKSTGPSTIAEAKSALKSAVGKPPAISTSKTSSAKPAAKSPAITPTSATSKTAPTKSTTAASKPPRASMASSTSSSTKERLSSSTSTGGFVKPKPRSPTRTVNLPSHLTAPTASSAAKHESEASSNTRKPTSRDRTSSFKPPVPAVRKQASRASLPPQSAARSESRTSTAAPDSGFLARMMRPTASSASKSHDKVEVKSPPRRAPAPAQAKPKAASTTVSKAKTKLSEGLAKAKDKVTPNGSGDHETSTAPAEDNAADDVATETQAVVAETGEATPDVTSNDLTAETPHFEGATIR